MDSGTQMNPEELEKIRRRVREIEEEAEKLRKIQVTDSDSPTSSQQQRDLSPASATGTGYGQGGIHHHHHHQAMNTNHHHHQQPQLQSHMGGGTIGSYDMSRRSHQEYANDISMEHNEIDTRSIYVGNVDYSTTAEELESHFHGCGSINRVTILCDKFSGTPKGFAYVEFSDVDSIPTALALDDSVFKGRQVKVSRKRTNKPGISSTDRYPRGSRRSRGRFYYGGYRGRFSYPRPYYGGRGRGSWYYTPY